MVFFEGLKERFNLLRWFIEGCHQKRFMMRNTFLKSNIIIDSFADFRLTDLLDKLPPLISNLDEKSIRNIEQALEINFMLHNKSLVFDKWSYLSENEISEYQKFNKKDKQTLSKKYDLPKEHILSETFMFHHGLRNADRRVKDYIQNKIFLDCGAFLGDSAIVLLNYSPSKIYSFDISSINIDHFHNTMKKSKVTKDQVELLPYGIGAENKKIKFQDGLSGGTSTLSAGNSEVELITLDSFCRDKPRIGFIKVDIEGAGLDMVKGMVELLRRDRPVLSLAIYHTPEEFFLIKPFIESLDLNYKFQVLCLSDWVYGELTLFAYPDELDIK